MNARTKKVLMGVGVALVGIQLIRPAHENPPVKGALVAPSDITVLLKRACYDCHSNETIWPWYSQIAPVSWLVAHDVNEGREHLNFSEWASYAANRKLRKLDEIESEVSEGEMPMFIYLPMHPEAKLSDAEKRQLVEWAKRQAENEPSGE